MFSNPGRWIKIKSTIVQTLSVKCAHSNATLYTLCGYKIYSWFLFSYNNGFPQSVIHKYTDSGLGIAKPDADS